MANGSEDKDHHEVLKKWALLLCGDRKSKIQQSIIIIIIIIFTIFTFMFSLAVWPDTYHVWKGSY